MPILPHALSRERRRERVTVGQALRLALGDVVAVFRCSSMKLSASGSLSAAEILGRGMIASEITANIFAVPRCFLAIPEQISADGIPVAFRSTTTNPAVHRGQPNFPAVPIPMRGMVHVPQPQSIVEPAARAAGCRPVAFLPERPSIARPRAARLHLDQRPATTRLARCGTRQRHPRRAPISETARPRRTAVPEFAILSETGTVLVGTWRLESRAPRLAVGDRSDAVRFWLDASAAVTPHENQTLSGYSGATTMSALVYDIGLHDGRDTWRYLREGCHVVALDANPVMCATAEANFQDYVRTGQLKVINRGVAAHRGKLEFWVCDDVSEWSSFNPQLASRCGSRHHAITVECIPILDIIDEFGIADYMKIDIEGYDRVCIEGLSNNTTSKYISIELDHFQGDQDIRRLFELGYRDFKIICQNDSWKQVTIKNIWYYNQLAKRRLILRCWRRLRRATSLCLSGRRLGESGPWGEMTSGPWHSVDHAQFVWRVLHELGERFGSSGGWYDIHARK